MQSSADATLVFNGNSSTTTIPCTSNIITRTTYSIVSSCLSTMLICVWSAIHADIPTRPQDSSGSVAFKIKWMLLGIISPSLLLFIAVGQAAAAIVLLRSAYHHLVDLPLPDGWIYTRVFLRGVLSDRSRLTSTIDGRRQRMTSAGQHTNQPLYSDTATSDSRRRKHAWTLTHAFYAVMGGFVIDTIEPISIFGDRTRFTLTPVGVSCIMLYAPHILPDLSTLTIQDRSKADGLAKTILVSQVLHFCVSCIIRRVQSLPLSLLEVTTLAHACCTLLTYLVWWEKPVNIAEPTLITGSNLGETKEIAATLLMSSSPYSQLPGGIFISPCEAEIRFLDIKDHSDPNLERIIATDAQESTSFGVGDEIQVGRRFYSISHLFSSESLRNLKDNDMFKDTELPWYTQLLNNDSKAVLSRKDIQRWTLREGATQHFVTNCGPVQFDSVLWFTFCGYLNADNTLGGFNSWEIVLQHRFPSMAPTILTMCTAIYGLPHMIGWNTQFRSHAQEGLWRSAILIISFMPITPPVIVNIALIIVFIVSQVINRSNIITFVGLMNRMRNSLKTYSYYYSTPFVFLLCVFGGVVLVTLSIRQLLELPQKIFERPSILHFWPHVEF